MEAAKALDDAGFRLRHYLYRGHYGENQQESHHAEHCD